MWRQLKHPHILPFLGVDDTTFRGRFCMVSPFMHMGNIVSCAEYFLQIGADVPREPWVRPKFTHIAFYSHKTHTLTTVAPRNRERS